MQSRSPLGITLLPTHPSRLFVSSRVLFSRLRRRTSSLPLAFPSHPAANPKRLLTSLERPSLMYVLPPRLRAYPDRLEQVHRCHKRVSPSSIAHHSPIQPLYPRGCYNAILAFNSGEWEVDSIDQLPDGSQPQISVEELTMCEVIVRNDPRVQALAKQIGKFRSTPHRQHTNNAQRMQVSNPIR